MLFSVTNNKYLPVSKPSNYHSKFYFYFFSLICNQQICLYSNTIKCFKTISIPKSNVEKLNNFIDIFDYDSLQIDGTYFVYKFKSN